MKIENVEAVPLSIPFAHGAAPGSWDGRDWDRLDTVLVRVDTDAGISGWGDAFAYNCRRAVQAAVEDMVAPLVLGRDATDIAGIMHDAQHALHLWGRYGITIFALSGLDIALWDLAARAAGVPLHRLLGGAGADGLTAYASLFKYGVPETVAERTRAAIDEGYGFVKLHETGVPEVAAARQAAGQGFPIMVDTNCPWTPDEARRMAERLAGYDLHWLEEPIFPPEDFESLARLQDECGIPLAAGENACTAFQFAAMIEAGAVTYAQPSVTKVGGVTEFRKVGALAEAAGIQVMPHAPYFGPGFLATLHLMAATPRPGLVERLYVSPEASLYGDMIEAQAGVYAVPDGPGVGPDPDADVIKDYRASDD
jgi:L-alanine-DL-glutamate epimerase-like enolase superfamily enzyme